MKLEPESRKQLLRIAGGTAICTAAMWVLFAALHLVGWVRFDYTVVLASLVGAAVAIGNFAGICFVVQKIIDEPDEKKRKATLQLSYNSRMLLQAVWVVVAIAAPCFQPFAGVLPLFFPRITIYYLQITGKYKPLTPKAEPADVSAEDDPEPADAQQSARDGIAASEENTRLRELLNLREKHTDYEMESCKVVLWSSSNWSSSFTISKGRSSGIELNDPVVTEYGVVVGQVTELGETWATVSTLIDVDMSVGAFVGAAGNSGMVVGEYSFMKNKTAKLTFLADGAQIFVGDDVLTSGSGGAFPSGLVIGTLTAVQTEAGGQIEYGIVEPQCDLDSLVQVFIIKSFEVVE